MLRQHGITTLADVRPRPYSRWSPHFQKRPLVHSLANEGIDYVFLGHALGGRPDGDELYDARGQLVYERRARARDFVAGIDELIGLAREHSTAIICAEEDPARCHRRLLITPALRQNDIAVIHIRGDGRLQPEDQGPGPRPAQLPLL